MKPNKLFPFFLLIIFSPLVLAEINLPLKSNYLPDQPLTFSGTYNNPNILVAFQVSFEGTQIWFDQTQTQADSSFSATFYPSTAGTYTLYLSCGGEAKTTTFCVGTPEQCKKEPSPKETPNGGGPSGTCSPSWSCDPWSYCNAQLKQSRLCHDKNNCRSPKTETQSCSKCEESWLCSLWSGCQNNQQTRQCYDEHQCQTSSLKPSLKKACDQPASGPSPVQIIDLSPEKFSPPPTPPPTKFSFQQFLEKYWLWFLAALILLVLITISLLLFFHFHKKKPAPNLEKLSTWVAEARQKGATDQQLRQLALRSGWSEEDLNKVL